MFESGDTAAAVVEREGLKPISDTGELERMIDEAIAANPKQVEQYKGGRVALLGFSFLVSALGDCDPNVPCKDGLIWSLFLPAILITAVAGLSMRWLINWLVGKRKL